MATTPWPPDFDTLLRTHLPLLDSTERVTPDLPLSQYGLDSLATVTLLLELEDQYEVSVPDELLSATTFADPASLWAVVTELRGQESAA
ncbi:phosphopantetheine-binding protein [Streptomyces sp. NPDC005408]|uniref:phosphopantetheine-binding protein n=1 Tax=Streptomyces sp. NPDC005408 TaxID=3155341 RepID=UPI0033BCE085